MTRRGCAPMLVDSIVSQSFLAALPPDEMSEILAGGRSVAISAGTVVSSERSIGLVVEGLVRVFIRSDGGRQVTVYYARPGDTLGLCHLCGRSLDLGAQTLTATVLYSMSRAYLRKRAATSPPLALAIAGESAARLGDAMEEISLLTFKSVRQRVARHLLDLASAQDDALVATVTQQELADATGSVRAVVARELKALERRAWIRRVSSGIEILDAARLDAEARQR